MPAICYSFRITQNFTNWIDVGDGCKRRNLLVTFPSLNICCMWYASDTSILKLSPTFCRQHHDVTKINMTKIKRVFWVWAWQIAKSFIVSESDSKFLNKSKKYEVLIGRKFFHFRASHWLFSIYFHASEYCFPLMIFVAMIEIFHLIGSKF